MTETAIEQSLNTAIGHVGDLLNVGFDVIENIMTNEWVLLFFGFTLVMWGIKLFHSIRKAV